MKEDVIGRRYAKALIQLAQEQGQLAEVSGELAAFVSLFQENDTLRQVLCDPIHDRKKRKAILQEVLQKTEIKTVCANFLLLLLDKERIRYLSAIFSAFRRLEDGIAGRLRAQLIVAGELESDDKSAIQKALGDRFQKEIILEWFEDPEILGGIICKVDGMVFDGSVKTQLETLKETMKGE